MSDTPEIKIQQASPPRGGVAEDGTAPGPHGWHMSEEERAEELRSTENAEARERWERRQSGWALFAVTMLVMAGCFQVINGLVGLLRSETYLVGPSGLVVEFDYTTWGWVHLGLGLLAGIAGLGLLRGHLWARILGVTLAVLSAITYLAFLPAFPALGLVVIATDILVIYAIAVHGGELEDVDS